MKPTTYYPFASQDLTQEIPEGTVPNKAAPDDGVVYDFISIGLPHNVGMPIQYYNYQLDGYSKWIQHEDEKWGVGDIYEHRALIPAGQQEATQESVEDQFGGTWGFVGYRIPPSTTRWTIWKKIS